MPAKNAPGLGLQYGWNLGESGAAVKAGLDLNVVKLSALLGGSVKSRTTSLPGSPAEGDRYIVPSNAASNANAIAVRADGAWVYIAPVRGLVLAVEDEGCSEVQTNGTIWFSRVAALKAIATSPANSTAGFDFLTLELPVSELAVGTTLEAVFHGTQSQSAATQDVVFYAKINDGAAVVVGQVGTGAAAQSYRSVSGHAILTLLATGTSGSYALGGSLTVNGLTPYASNSGSGRVVNTSTGLKLTLGVRCTVANAANFNSVTVATIRKLG